MLAKKEFRHLGWQKTLNYSLIALLTILVVLVIAAYAAGFFDPDSNTQRWASNILNGAGVLGAILSASNIYTAFIKRKEIRQEMVQRVLDALELVAAHRTPSWGGRLPHPTDYLAVPWSYVNRIGVNHASLLENKSHGNVKTLAKLMLTTDRSVLVLGDSGAGKTTLAELIQAVNSSQTRLAKGRIKRVPVYLHISSWDPTQEDLLVWVLRQLPRRAAFHGVSLEASNSILLQVLRSGQCILLLDGFDELPESRRSKAIRNIAQTPTGPVVILSQGSIEDFTSIDNRLLCDVIALRPLSVSEVIEHLKGVIIENYSWEKVIDRIEHLPDSNLASVLRRPLFLTLATHMLQKQVDPPGSFLKNDSTISQIEEILLKAEIGAALAGEKFRPSRLKASHKRKEKWLQSLARIQLRQRRENIVWWDLADAAPWLAKAVVGALLIYLFMYALMVLSDAGIRLIATEEYNGGAFLDSSSIEFFALISFIVIATIGNSSISNTGEVKWYRSRAMRFGIACTLSFLIMFSDGWNRGFAGNSYWGAVIGVGLAYSMGAFLIRGIFIEYAGEDHPNLQKLWRSFGWITDNLPRAVPRQVGWAWSWRKAAGGTVVGFILSTLFLGGPFSILSEGLSSGTDFPGLAGAVSSTFVLYAIIFAALLSFGKPLDADKSTSFSSAVRSNLIFGAILPCLWVSAIWIMTRIHNLALLAVNSDAGLNLKQSIFGELDETLLQISIIGLFLFITFGALGLLVTLGGRFFLALIWLRFFNQLPFRFFVFLDWAHGCGLLRRQGAAYSFRHARLRKILAEMDMSELAKYSDSR